MTPYEADRLSMRSLMRNAGDPPGARDGEQSERLRWRSRRVREEEDEQEADREEE